MAGSDEARLEPRGTRALLSGESPAPAVRRHPSVWSRWWVRVLGVYAAGRVVTTVFLLLLASVQQENPWTLAHPDYFSYANIWDGRWYEIVALYGYPEQLPLDHLGHVAQNAWAFMPGYAFLVRSVMELGVSWSVAAVLASAAFGAGTCLLFYRFVEPKIGPGRSLFAVVLLCAGPLSPLFQVAYAEAMQLFLLMLALLLLTRRRHGPLFFVIPILAFTRPSGLAFALALGLYALARWWRRGVDAFGLRERIIIVALAAEATLAGFAWPAVAGWVTGSPSAYTDTELAWRVGYIGYQPFVPFASWFQGANWWLGFPLGAIAVIVLLVLFALLMVWQPVRQLGLEAWVWCVAYACYLFAVFFPQSSTFRLLAPMFVLLAALTRPTGWIGRTLLTVLMLAAQVAWLLLFWGIDGQDWTPP